MQIAIIQTEAADFVKINICVILKTFGHDCIVLSIAGTGNLIQILTKSLGFTWLEIS